ncbi:unnamed protein product, partial [Rotaria sp. Silwood1]
QSINNKQAENPILKSKSSQYKEENVSFNEQFSIIDEHHSVEQPPSIYPAQQTLPPHDMKTVLGPSSSFINAEETLRSSVTSINPQGLDLPTNTSSIPKRLQLNSNMNNERKLDELQYTALHQLSPTTTFDQNNRLKLEVERLTKELELIKLQQSQQQSHIRASHSDTSCAIVQQPTTTIT